MENKANELNNASEINNASKVKEKKRVTVTGVISNIVTILFVAILVFLLYSLFASRNGNNVSLGPYEYMNVLTGSMEPAISVGDLIIIKHSDTSTIVTGDIITYNPGSDVNVRVTHRVVEVLSDERGFVTKGDANEVNDNNAVQNQSVIGKVVLVIPYLGSIIAFLVTPAGIIVAGILFFLYILIEAIIKGIITSKNQKKLKSADGSEVGVNSGLNDNDDNHAEKSEGNEGSE